VRGGGIAYDGLLKSREAVGVLTKNPGPCRFQIPQRNAAAEGFAQPGQTIIGFQLNNGAERVRRVQPETTPQWRISESDWNDPHFDNFHDPSLISTW
jgi:hypothetical protein